MKRQIVLDTETTGLEPKEGHRIIEFGAVEIIDRQVTGNTQHFYFNPDREVDAGAASVHGITNEFLKDKPRFKDLIGEMMDFINGAELIIHNAPFDLGFLNHELSLLKESCWHRIEDHCQILDTLVMARKKFPRQRNSLDALCKRFTIDNSKRELHGALLDSEILAEVYLMMTGGQSSLGLMDMPLEEKAVQAEATESIVEMTSDIPLELVVVKATESEIQLNQSYFAEKP